MKNQIIPINRDAVIDDTLIRLVNENHARSVREKQIEAIRKRRAFDRLVNNLFYVVIGMALGVLTFTLFLGL